MFYFFLKALIHIVSEFFSLYKTTCGLCLADAKQKSLDQGKKDGMAFSTTVLCCIKTIYWMRLVVFTLNQQRMRLPDLQRGLPQQFRGAPF